MNDFATPVAVWLADYFLLGTVLLLVTLITLALLKQPAHRLAVTKSTFVALFLLALLCALPGWSIVHLLSADQPRLNASPATSTQTKPIAAPKPIVLPSTDNAATAPIVPAVASPRAAFWSTLSRPTIFASAYALGSACGLAWLAFGSLAAHRLVKSATPAPPQLLTVFASLTNNNDPNVRLLLSRKIDVAVAIGIRRPAILLPEDLNNSFSPLAARHSPLSTILAHELAHITNHDLHWLAVSRALLILLWPQPLFWFLRRRTRLDQETLADAAAAELTTRQSYAEQLVTWARNLPPHPAPRLSAAVGLWEGPSQLRQRIALLLDEHFTVLRNCSRRLRLGALALAIMATLTLSTITIQPQQPAAAQPTAAQGATSTAGNSKPPNDIPRPIPNTILGRTLDEAGKPIAAAEVFLFRVNRFDHSRSLVAQQISDADGNFRFDNVIDIAKEFPGRKFPSLDDLGEELLQSIVRAPGRVSEFRTELPQQVAKDGTVAWIRMKPGTTLQGRITDPSGKPVRDAFVSTSVGMLGNWDGIQSARTDADGKYTISDAAPFDGAKYREQQEAQKLEALRADRGKGDATLFFAPPMLTIKHPDFAVTQTAYESIPGTKDVQLAPAAVLEGRVVFGDSGKPASGVIVQAITSNPNGILPRMDQIYSYHRAAVRADADGKYRFTNLPADTYDIWAEGNLGRSWKMPAAAGAYDVWAEPADWLDAGANQIAAIAAQTTTVPDLKLIKGGLIQVRLVDAKTREPISLAPDTSAYLDAVPPGFRSSRPTFPKVVSPNADGKFEIRTLPGENRVIVGFVKSSGEAKWRGNMEAGVQIPTVKVENETTSSVDVPVIAISESRSKVTGEFIGSQITGTVSVIPKTDIAKKPREVVDALTELLDEHPDDTDALLARSQAWQRLGEYAKAVTDLEHLIRLNPAPPKDVIVLNNLAIMLSTVPNDSVRDGKRAVELSLRSQELLHETAGPAARAMLLDTLAAAYAETGDFDLAVKTQQEAVELHPANEDIRKHLELYRNKLPLREPRPAPDQSDDKKTGETNQPIDIPIIVAKHVLLHDGKIIEWADVEKLVAALPNPKLARPEFYFTHGALPERQEEIRAKIWEFRRRQPMAGHTWASIQPRTSFRYDAVHTAADLMPNKDWHVAGTVETPDGLPIDGAEVVLITPVDDSLPYKIIDIYLRNEQLRQPIDEDVTTSDNSGRFAAYPPPNTPYYLIALHKEGFGLARSDEFAKTRRVRIFPWAHIRGQLKDDPRFKQSASAVEYVPESGGWPYLTFHQYSEDLSPAPPDGRFEFAFIPPNLQGTLSRMVAGEQGVSHSLPEKEFELKPTETLNVDIDPPTDADIERLKSLRGITK